MPILQQQQSNFLFPAAQNKSPVKATAGRTQSERTEGPAQLIPDYEWRKSDRHERRRYCESVELTPAEGMNASSPSTQAKTGPRAHAALQQC